MVKSRNKFLVQLPIALAIAVASGPSHAQFMAIMGGATSIFTQVTNKLTSQITGGEKATDIEAERNQFFNNMERQTAGMDAAPKKQLLATMEKQWDTTENMLLMRNAQVQQSKDGPLIDFKRVAADSLGGLSAQMGMNAAFGSSGLADVISNSAMDGLISGVSGAKPTNAANSRLSVMQGGFGGFVTPASTGAIANAAVNSAVSGGITSAVNTAVGGQMNSLKPASGWELPQGANPVVFMGKHPRELLANDLYRENGFIGWKRIDKSATAQAYAPVAAGTNTLKAAVFNFDPANGNVNAAFRVLSEAPTEFSKVVDGVTSALQDEPRYASTGSIVRAVWANGAFATADSSKIIVGWSALVPQVYNAAAPAVTAAR